MFTTVEATKAPHSLSTKNSNIIYIIRILAAELVLVGHMLSYFQVTILKDESVYPSIQSQAVLIFFLLSGFLTTYSLRRKPDSYTFSQFAKDHYKRIFSYFIPALLFVLCIDGYRIATHPELYIYADTFTLSALLKNLLMLPHNYVPFGSGRPFWTLYIEWWFYIGFGYLYLILRKKYKSDSLSIFHAILFAALLYFPFRTTNHSCLAALFFGVGIELTYSAFSSYSKVLLLFSFPVLFLYSLHFKDPYHISQPILFALLLLQLLLWGDKKESVFSKPCRSFLKFASGCTFPLYLIHYTILDWVIYMPPTNSTLWNMVIVFITSHLTSILFYTLIQFCLHKFAKKH